MSEPIPHTGGSNPVPGKLVKVELRNDRPRHIPLTEEEPWDPSEEWRWEHRQGPHSGGDIIAYIVKED